MFQHVHMLLCVCTSFGSAVGHIRDRVPQKWVSRCHEGDLAARCSPPEAGAQAPVLVAPTRPLDRPPVFVARSRCRRSSSFAPFAAEWNRL